MRILLVMFVILSFTQMFVFYGGLESLTGRLVHQEPSGGIGGVIFVPLKVGESKKIELTGDAYYDISVMLHSVEDSKANLKFERVYEKISGNLNDQKEVIFSPPQIDSGITTAAVITESNENTQIIIISFIMIATAVIFLLIAHFIPPFTGR